MPLTHQNNFFHIWQTSKLFKFFSESLLKLEIMSLNLCILTTSKSRENKCFLPDMVKSYEQILSHFFFLTVPVWMRCHLLAWLQHYILLPSAFFAEWKHRVYLWQHAYLRRGLKGRVDGDLWHVPVVDVLVAVPHTVDQIGLESKGELYLEWSHLIN